MGWAIIPSESDDNLFLIAVEQDLVATIRNQLSADGVQCELANETIILKKEHLEFPVHVRLRARSAFGQLLKSLEKACG
jgi:hypothetical protein